MNKSKQAISVLIVEDEPSLNDAYKRILESERIDVRSSFNGREALDELKSMQPDVILLDLKMPVMDGIEFLQKLPKTKAAGKAKVIIFSNYDEQAEIKDAFALGATKYMLKAWASPSEVVKVVKEVVNSD
ncbi:MAG TPA: response regulator [Candidatus Saccharimonadales bacterium]|nr:response regulator [Candidatus Saccharimonadales bacterium]